MADFSQAMNEFHKREAQRAAKAEAEIEHLKQAILGPLRDAGIARVEVRFDGCGDSGVVEACECMDGDLNTIDCPQVAIAPYDFEVRERAATMHRCCSPRRSIASPILPSSGITRAGKSTTARAACW